MTGSGFISEAICNGKSGQKKAESKSSKDIERSDSRETATDMSGQVWDQD